jgi:hypothetical protein
MLNAVLVCVDYADILAITLPYNRHHFDRVLIVTAPDDACLAFTGVEFHVTDAFYRNGARFNKWLALEEALDAKDYRRGWLCIMDADILWPRVAPLDLQFGRLYSPHRRMKAELEFCPESEWIRYPLHRNTAEWAGYSQVFHCDDPVLGKSPWHEVDWTHAGGADSFFQRKWAHENKIRPTFEVLHLGEPGINWMGRADKNPTLRVEMLAMWQRRRIEGFKGEKLP